MSLSLETCTYGLNPFLLYRWVEIDKNPVGQASPTNRGKPDKTFMAMFMGFVDGDGRDRPTKTI